LSYGDWLAAPRRPKFFNGDRIVFREIPGANKRIQATILTETSYYGHSITPFVIFSHSPYDLRFFLGISNSKLISWYGRIVMPNFGKDIFPKLNPQDVAGIPIASIDFSHKFEREQHDELVQLVEQMIEALSCQGYTPLEKEQLDRRIIAIDVAIDRLVYELFGLTDEEIRIVESNS